jgi:hypothetical protein
MTEQTLSIESLERQRYLWLQLARALERAQGALLRGEVAVFEECTKEQGECCHQLIPRRELERAWGQGQPNSVILEEIESAQQRVRHLNRVHAALLRRASRSLEILRNLMRQTGTIYAPSVSWQQQASTLLPRG